VIDSAHDLLVAGCRTKPSAVASLRSPARSGWNPAFAQKAEIEAVNAKWIDFFKRVISPASFAGPRG
jgi:hypothetical protein